MTIFGIGPSIALTGVCGVAIVIAIDRLGHFRLSDPTSFHHVLLMPVGAILAAIGICFWMASIIQIAKGFPAGKLVTSGIYGLSRNPMYAAFIVFLTPAIAFLLNNLCVLIVSLIMYIVFKFRIRQEELYLQQTFGADFDKYSKAVPQLIPFVHI